MNILERDASPKITSFISLVALFFFLPLLYYAARQSIELITRATGTPANIIVDTKAVLEPIKTDFYHAFAQGGEEAEDMIAPVVGQVKALRPKMIRIDHIYDNFNVVKKDGGNLSFDWSRLDGAVNTILSTGAKPLLSLSFMPAAIAKGGVIINPPDNWEDWATVVQKTIEHYSGKGDKNLGGVYYEVWNEPDLGSFGSWKLSGEKNYLTLYKYASDGAKRAGNTNYFYLGGPATTGMYKNWIMALASSGHRVDFFSWHSYLPDPKKYSVDQDNFINWMLPYPWHTLKPTMITEFGFTGDKSTLYNTTYAAAYTAAAIRQMISGGASYMFSFELKDGPGQTNGWGLIGHQNAGAKTKPRYAVYAFMDQMIGNRLQLTGEGTWVTGFASTKEKTIKLFLVNFDRSGSHVETVPVKFTNLDPGNYSVRQHFLFGADSKTQQTISEGTFEQKIFMGAQTMVIVELTKTD
jgi:hypothetical protein